MPTSLRIFEHPLVESLGWALLHFVWEGLAIALLLAIALRFLRRHSAPARYVALCGAMLAAAICPIATWSWLASSLPSEPDTTTPAMKVASETSAVATPLAQSVPEFGPSVTDGGPAPAGIELPPILVERAPVPLRWKDRLRRGIEPALPWLVCGWLFGIALLSARLLAGWTLVRRIQRLSTKPAPDEWRYRLQELAMRLGVRRTIQLIESALVEVPTVIGWLRPMILVPASALCGLAPSQLEALLAHEIAHIRRHDYLLNLIQTAIETLLFYHPAVWWISRRLREERENCCDDLAVAVCGDKVTYARALATMEELRPQPVLTLAADGGSLLKRIRRLLEGPARPTDRASRRIAPSGVVVVLGIATACLMLALATQWQRPAEAAGTDDQPTEAQAGASGGGDEDKDPASSDSSRKASDKADGAAQTKARAMALGDELAASVERTIEKSKAYLVSRQNRDGSWTIESVETHSVGISSLALAALIRNGMPVTAEPVRKGLEYLRSIKDPEPRETYDLSLLISALTAAKDQNRDRRRITDLTKRLGMSQLRSGTWSYNTAAGDVALQSRGDHSNGQHAVLALRDAADYGVDVPRELWKKARVHWLEVQNTDGSWDYSGAGSTSTGSMTAAGLSVLAVTEAVLRDKADAAFDETPRKNAVAWMGRHFSVTRNPGAERTWHLYYLHSLSRASQLSGLRLFGEHDWYREGAEYLVSTQKDGVWQGESSIERDPILATSYALLFLSRGPVEEVKNAKEKNAPAPPDPKPDQKSASDSAARQDKTVGRIHGRVLGSDGKPVPKAFVSAIGTRFSSYRGGDLSPQSEVLGEAVTDDDGRYEIKLPRVTAATHLQAAVVARSATSGISWQRIDPEAAVVEASFELPAEQVIRVRLVDSEGKPAVGVQLSVSSLVVADPLLTREVVGYDDFEKRPKAWPPVATTDEEGRVKIRHVAAGQGVHLRATGTERFAPQDLAVNTGISEARTKNDATYRPTVKNVPPGEEAVLPLAPAQWFEGVVRYGDTGKPAPHARLTIYSSQQNSPSMYGLAGMADDEGRFRINPFPGAQFRITAYPPDGTPYLIRQLPEIDRTEAGTQQKDVTFRRGVLVRGRVVENETRTAVGDAVIQYIPENRNPNRSEEIVTAWQAAELSDEKGAFQIAVLAGAGTLLVHGARGKYVLQETTSEQIARGRPGGSRNYAHGIQRIDPPRDAAPMDLTFELQPAVTLSGRITTTTGEPVERALVITRLNIAPSDPQWRGFPLLAFDGRFELAGLGEDQEYPTYFLDAKNRLGATVTFRSTDKSPTVVLQPCGEASARFVDDQGNPLAGHRPSIQMVVTPGVQRFSASARTGGMLAADEDHLANIDRKNHWSGPATSDDGRITLPALIPGARYRITTFEKGNGVVLKEFVVESGKTTDLGEIRMPTESR